MDSFTVKQGDRREALQRTLKDSAGVKVDLTAATIKFRMRKKRGSAGVFKVDTAATIVGTATDGVVKYSWAAADTDDPPGTTYRSWFEVTFSDATKQSFPNEGHILVLLT